MDYLIVGSNGFAQVGDPSYYAKNKAEMKVLLSYFHHNFPIPAGFKTMAYYSVKTFPHDFGDYHEVVLWYDRDYLNELEESEDEADQQTADLFWSWFRVIEGVDLEAEELTNQIKEAYFKSLNVSKAEHLSVMRAS